MPGHSPPALSRRIRLLHFLRILLTLCTLGAVLYYVLQAPRPDLSAMEPAWKFIWPALASLIPLVWVRAAKWRWIVHTKDVSVTHNQSLKSYLGAMPLSLMTPGRVGEFSRCLYLPQKGFHTLQGAGLVLVDNISDSAAVAAWAIPGFALLWGRPGFLLGLLIFILIYPMTLWLRIGHSILNRLPELRGLRGKLLNLVPKAEEFTQRRFVAVFMAGLAAYGLEWFQSYCLLRFFMPTELTFGQVAGLFSMVALINSAQITLAGLGIREGLAVFLLHPFGIPAETALLVAFGTFCLNQLLPALPGLFFKPVALYHPFAEGEKELSHERISRIS